MITESLEVLHRKARAGSHCRKLVPDLIVDGKVIADPKVVSVFHDTHIAQMLGYLNITD